VYKALIIFAAGFASDQTEITHIIIWLYQDEDIWSLWVLCFVYFLVLISCQTFIALLSIQAIFEITSH